MSRGLFIVISILGFAAQGALLQPIPTACQSKALEKELSKLQASFFSDKLDLKSLTSYTNKLGELNDTYPQISDPACRKDDEARLKDKTGKSDTVSLKFRKLHYKVLETTTANEMLHSCSKGKNLLNDKIDRIVRKLAGTKDLNSCPLEKQAALSELDLFSKLTDKQEKIGRGISVDGVILPTGSVKEIEKQLYYQSPEAHSDNLSFSSVHAANPNLVRMNSEQVTKERHETARDIKLRQNQGAEATEASIRKKFGFETFGDYVGYDDRHKNSADYQERTKRLHLALMDGNRINCLSNYLYFTNRFSFAPEKPKPVVETVNRLFGDSFGNEPKNGVVPGMSHNKAELTKLGEQTLKSFATTYKDAPILDEDTVLKMLEPTIELMNEAKNYEIQSKQTLGMYADQETINNWRKNVWIAKEMGPQKRAEALEASSHSEVGFLYGTKALEKLRFVDGIQIKDEKTGLMRFLNDAEKQQKKREIVRAALKERIDQSEDYAKKVRENQTADGKSLKSFTKDGEMLLYASPVVISSVIQSEPELLASMCDPLGKAAKTLQNKPSEFAQDLKYAGGAMTITGNPIGMVAGTTFGLVGTGIAAIDHARKAALQERLASVAGKGESILDTDVRLQAETDKKELNELAQKNREAAWEEVQSGLKDIATTVVMGKAGKLIAGEIMAARQAAKVKKITGATTDELTKAREYFNFETRIKNAANEIEKTELMNKQKGWNEFISTFENKLGRSLSNQEIDEFMVYGFRAHITGKVTQFAGNFVQDEQKVKALQNLKGKVQDKIQVETGKTTREAKVDAFQVVDKGANGKRLTFGDVKKPMTLDEAKIFVAKDGGQIKKAMEAAGLKETPDQVKYLTSELETFADDYARVMTEASKDGSSFKIKKLLDEQLKTYRTMLSHRAHPSSITKGEQFVDDILAKRGISFKNEKFVFTAPSEPVRVVASTTKTADESLDALDVYRKKYDGKVLTDANRELFSQAPSSKLNKTLQAHIEEQKAALKEIQDIKKTYGSQFSASNVKRESNAVVDMNYRERSLQQSIDELSSQQSSVQSAIKSNVSYVQEVEAGLGETRDYALKNSLEKFSESGKQDAGFIKKVKDEIRSVERMRSNFSEQDVPGLNSKKLDDHLKRLNKYLNDVGAAK